jgi:hypothetical protein
LGTVVGDRSAPKGLTLARKTISFFDALRPAAPGGQKIFPEIFFMNQPTAAASEPPPFRPPEEQRTDDGVRKKEGIGRSVLAAN